MFSASWGPLVSFAPCSATTLPSDTYPTPVIRAWPEAVITRGTVISDLVSVPVLSEAMTEAEPSVSTEDSFLTMARCLAIRCTPSASTTDKIAGSPSGTAATASETPSSFRYRLALAGEGGFQDSQRRRLGETPVGADSVALTQDQQISAYQLITRYPHQPPIAQHGRGDSGHLLQGRHRALARASCT
jgi:hypothetical protein